MRVVVVITAYIRINVKLPEAHFARVRTGSSFSRQILTAPGNYLNSRVFRVRPDKRNPNPPNRVEDPFAYGAQDREHVSQDDRYPA